MKVFDGEYFNGKNASSEQVQCSFTDNVIEFQLSSGEKKYWLLNEIFAEVRGSNYGVVKNKKEEILFNFQNYKLIEELLFPRRVKFTIPMLLISLATTVTVFYLFIPYMAYSLAKIIPSDLEKKFSDPLFNQFQETNCDDPHAQKILQSFLKHLDPKSSDYEILLSSRDEINAFALPGNRIVVLKGLIDFVDTPDELFAVLAHERAHIKNQHHIRLLIKRHFFSLFFSSLSGNLGSVLEAIGALALAYTVPEEVEADKAAITLLKKHNLPLKGGIHFFSKLAKRESQSSGYFNITHPGSQQRIELWSAATDRGRLENHRKWYRKLKKLKASCAYF